jgi:tetratricopeptide (TPR) repeat protein
VSNFQPNAETFRIRSLAYFMTKDMGQARLEIRKALEMEPHNENIRFTSAIIDYLSALSHNILPAQLPPWPLPVEWTFVLRDDDSLSRLREAEKVFNDLLKMPGRSVTENQTIEAWRLACLMNDPKRQDEAIHYSQSILKANPAHYQAIAWVTSRNLDVSLTASKKAISRMILKRKSGVFHVIALVEIYLASKEAIKALRVLEKTEPLFQKQGEEALWTLWHVQVLLSKGNPEAALKELEQAVFTDDVGRMHVKTMVLQALAKKTGNWQELVDHLESNYLKTEDPKFFLEICELMAHRKNWDYIAERALDLIQKVTTSEVLRLAAIASYNAKRFELCLRLLDDFRNLFPNQKLPNELRRLRVLVTQAVGSLPEAIAEQEALVHDEDTTPNLLKLAQLYFEKGDLKGLSIVARDLVVRDDLEPDDALQVARLVQLEDQVLAIELWKKAMSRGVSDALVSTALTLGYHLGLDKELGPLTMRMQKLGKEGRGGIQVALIKDLMAMINIQQKRSQELHELYLNGTVPIHLIAGQVNRPLVDLYHSILAENEAAPDPYRQFPLLLRHGGRVLTPGFPKKKPKWQLNMDLTAILLAQHLEILNEVELTFSPLRIPSDLIPTLIGMCERLSHAQPSRLKALQQILDLSQNQMIHTEELEVSQIYEKSELTDELGEQWVAFFDKARSGDGYLLEFLPLHKCDLSGVPSSLPQDADHYLINCRAVVEALRLEGPLSAEKYEEALKELGGEGKKIPGVTIPKQGKPLYCRGNTLEVLAAANLLHIVSERFDLHIEKTEIDIARAELSAQQRRSKVGDWLAVLIDRLRRGIEKKTYSIIPSLHNERQTEGESNYDLSTRCLLTLLTFEPNEDDVIWADDRYINSYPRRDSVQIVGVSEILKVLVGIGILSKDLYFDKINKLRSANAYYIPVAKDEIVHRLLQARIENGTLVETGELAVLRKYVAACLLRSDILQRPPRPAGSPNEHGEVAFVLGMIRAVRDGLLEVWAKENSDEGTRLAQADWILNNLHLDYLGLTSATSVVRSDHDERYIVGLSISGLLSQAISFSPSRGESGRHRRRMYFRWMFTRMLNERFHAEPALLVATVDNLKKILLSTRNSAINSDREKAMIAVLQKFYEDLPEIIQNELKRDCEFMTNIGFRPRPTIIIDRHSFEPTDFWKAASEVVNGRDGMLTTLETNREIIFQPLRDSEIRDSFFFVDSESGEKKLIKMNELELFLESPTEREEALRRNRYWFDCDGETLNRIVAEIVSMEDPMRRVEAVKSWIDSSMAVHYENLCNRYKKEAKFKFEELMPPSADGLLRHFRFKAIVDANVTFGETLGSIVQSWIRDEKLGGAIDRIVGFPVPIPASMLDEIAGLTSVERKAFLKKLLRMAGSPLSKIHLIRILLSFSDDAQAYGKLARKIAIDLLSAKGVEDFEAFLDVMKWVHGEFDYLPGTKTCLRGLCYQWCGLLRIAYTLCSFP